AEHGDCFGARTVVGGDCSGFAASTQVLARIETEGRRNSDGSGGSPFSFFLGIVFGAMCLTRVFDYQQPILFCLLKNGIHVRHLAIEMHWHNRADRPSSPPIVQAAI